MRLLKIFVCTIAVAAACVACKSQYDILLEGNDANAKYDAAFEYYNAGKYQKAAQLFESLAFLTSGTERDDTVHYYWGLSNYKFKDYLAAEGNFTSFIETFPKSVFTEDAMFLKIDCMFRGTYRYELDQTPTYKTMTEISTFLIEYPYTDKRDICDKMIAELTERLERKEYENARLYYKMEDYKAAKVALRNVLKDNAENQYREEILYHIAMSSYKFADMSVSDKQKARFLEFQDDYLNFIGEYPESKHRAELDALYNKVKKK